MKKSKPKPNITLFITIILINILGVIALASASIPIAAKNLGNPLYYLLKHFGLGIIPGIILGYLCYKIPLEYFRKYAFHIFCFTLFLTFLVFLPKIGLEIGGARRWIKIASFTFQPSEFLKLGFIIYLSAWLSSLSKKLSISKTFLPFLIVIAIISLFLILQPDVSTLGVIAVTGIIIYFCAGAPLYHLGILALIGIGSLGLLIKLAPYRLSRWFVFLNPEADPLGKGYQIKQSLIAVGSGGILGKGLGFSEQKYGYLPQPISDSIFAIFAEETGFIGALILIILFCIFAYEGIKLAKSFHGEKEKFLQLVTVGITSWIVFQAFIHIGAMIGILPLTGIPLPFISYGNSALLAELMAMGILLNISKKQKYD